MYLVCCHKENGHIAEKRTDYFQRSSIYAPTGDAKLGISITVFTVIHTSLRIKDCGLNIH